MLKSLKSKLVAGVSAASAGLLGAGQAAASVLPSDISSQFSDTQGDILTVGGLIIGLAVVALGIRWVKATFF